MLLQFSLVLNKGINKADKPLIVNSIPSIYQQGKKDMILLLELFYHVYLNHIANIYEF